MNNKKDLYKGFNPIYESMMSSMMEDKEKGTDKKPANLDAMSLVSTVMNTFFTILLNSKMENLKTPRGFQEVKNKILGTNNFGTFRQYIISVLDSLAAMDLAQKEAYKKNIEFVTQIFSQLESSLSDQKMFNALKKETITGLVTNFETDLKEREKQMQKTNPKLFGEVVKQGLVVKEAKRTGEETSVEDAEFRGKAFNKSKESLDAASAFVGMIDRDRQIAVLKNNEDIKRYQEIAQNLYKRAQDLQMIDRKGLRNIITPSGEIKRSDYMRQQDSLINDIIRQKKEYQRIKDGILKSGGLSTPEPVIPVCPPGQVFDPSKGICVPAKKQDDQSSQTGQDGKKKPPVPVPVKTCQFPISLGQKCEQVGDVQNKLMELIPSVKSYLEKKGGADKIYGKGTAAVCNIVWGYLSGQTGQALTSDLDQAMYDAIMALTEGDIDTSPEIFGMAIKDSKNWEMSIQEKLQEREEIKGAPVLSFDDFFSVIEESLHFAKLQENNPLDRLAKGKEKKEETSPSTVAPVDAKAEIKAKKLKDKCIKDSLAAGKVLPCMAGTGPVPGPSGESGASGESGTTGQEAKWKGLKPVNDGAYTIYYDESWSQWWGDFAKGALISGIIVGAALVTGGAGISLAIGAGLSPTAIALGTGVAAAKVGTITIAAGVIGGAGIAKWAGDDRKPVTILVYNGYIEPIAVKAMARGIYNSLTGTVSSQDILAIYSTLILCRGTFTESNGTAVSVWSELKKAFDKEASSGTLDAGIQKNVNDITTTEGVGGFFKDIGTDMGDIPGFPKSFKTKDPNQGIEASFETAKDACDDAIERLNSNEAKLQANLKLITEEDLELLSEGMEEVTAGVEDAIEEED